MSQKIIRGEIFRVKCNEIRKLTKKILEDEKTPHTSDIDLLASLCHEFATTIFFSRRKQIDQDNKRIEEIKNGN